MITPRWYSQPFPSLGSISAEGIKRTLGKPPIPWPAILVREAAQNSWDARLGDRSVDFTLSLGVVQPQHLHAWQSQLLAAAPAGDKFALRRSVRGSENRSPVIRTLTISDRGTKGLGGPTRANTVRGSAPRDWVSFVLNVGDPPDTKHGGGTYGYGKGVLYQVSRPGTVLVHTRTSGPNGFQNRLIGICLGESVELPDERGEMKPFTGRHWWGAVDGEHVDPLFDEEAVAAAAVLGLPRFEPGETGTDLVVVDPDFGDVDHAEMARYLADAVAWNLWPIMLERRGKDRLVPVVKYMGEPIPVPVPETTPGLKIFVAAYGRIKDGTGEVRPLSCGNPKRSLGSLAVERQLMVPYEPPAAAQDLGVTGAPHHVCLLRTPELVVKYHAGPVPFTTDLAYGGVFRAQDDLDRTYAAAEPPTHDDWVFSQLQGHERTFVKTTFTRLKEELSEFVRPAATSTAGARTPLGAISNFLGSLVATAGGTGSASLPFLSAGGTKIDSRTPAPAPVPEPRIPESYARVPGAGDVDVHPDPRGQGQVLEASGERRAVARLDGEPYFSDHAGELVLAQDVVVVGNGRLSVQGLAGVTMADGTREVDPPDNAEQPEILGWKTAWGVVHGSALDLLSAQAGLVLTLLVRPAPDTVTHVGLETVRVGGPANGR